MSGMTTIMAKVSRSRRICTNSLAATALNRDQEKMVDAFMPFSPAA